ncbi:hypothetical protein [Streptomyces qinglanensis]|uniref:Uncharacterized protein n=1 Tax=Streptomyces qinglanensis TaxID=943816 RepID=A0A1H9U5A3_9ACTN|nr:hypothetical protein [Streptomyces qinglanensis]SES04421.1 hypothetical protein SAMN05421870_107331 [Streptomyces qinglanensis]
MSETPMTRDEAAARAHTAEAATVELTADRDAARAEAAALRGQLAAVCGSTVAAWMQEQQRLITTLHAELEARPSRATVLREAAETAEGLRQFETTTGPRRSAQVSENVGVLRLADKLRRLADAAERDDAGKDTPTGGESTRAAVLREEADRWRREADGLPDAGQVHHKRVLYGGAIVLDRQAEAAERDEAQKDCPHQRESVRDADRRQACRCGQPGCEHCDTPEWYGLPWLAWLDELDQQAFLGEIASAALGYYRAEDDDADVLRSVVQACATYRLVAEADHAQATAPGPDAVEEQSVSGACERCGEPPESWCTHCAGCACPDGRAETHAPGGSCPNASAAGSGERQ